MRSLFAALLVLLPTVPVLALDLELVTARGGAMYVGSSSADIGYLVDTGSSYVVLTDAKFREVRVNSAVKYLRDVNGAFADGRLKRVPIYRVELLELAAGCTLRDVEVALVKGADRNILGMSGLQRMQPFTLATQPPILTTPGCA